MNNLYLQITIYIYYYREEGIIIAQNTPVFRHAPREIIETSLYPNVYDQYAVTQMSAAFVSGRKVNFL